MERKPTSKNCRKILARIMGPTMFADLSFSCYFLVKFSRQCVFMHINLFQLEKCLLMNDDLASI